MLIVVTAVNGIAEELFFRGAAYAAITRHPVVWTTVAYVVATAATGNVMLAFAAILLGIIVGLQRRASGGILAPIITHCTWSLIDAASRCPPSSASEPPRGERGQADAVASSIATRTASAYDIVSPGTTVEDRVVGHDDLGRHRVDEVLGGRGVDVGDERDPVRRQRRRQQRDRRRSAPGGRS